MNEELEYVLNRVSLEMPKKTIRMNAANSAIGDEIRRESIANLTFDLYNRWMKRFEDDFRLFQYPVPSFKELKSMYSNNTSNVP